MTILEVVSGPSPEEGLETTLEESSTATPPTGPWLPVEIQILIVKHCDWTQHPVLSRVCKLWKSIVSECVPARYRLGFVVPKSDEREGGKVWVHCALDHIPQEWSREEGRYVIHSRTNTNRYDRPISAEDYGFFKNDSMYRWENTSIMINSFIWHIHTPFYHRASAAIDPENIFTIQQFWQAVVITINGVFNEFSLGVHHFCEWTELGDRRGRAINDVEVWGFELSKHGDKPSLFRRLAASKSRQFNF